MLNQWQHNVPHSYCRKHNRNGSVLYCIVCCLPVHIKYFHKLLYHSKTNCKHNTDVIQQEATSTLWTDKRCWWWHVNTERTSTRWWCRSKRWRWRDMKSYIAGRWYKNTWRWWRHHLLCQAHTFISTVRTAHISMLMVVRKCCTQNSTERFC